MKRWLILLLLVFSLVSILTGCGPKTAEITVTMKEYEFAPTSLEVPASAEVTLTLINDGTLEHEMVIMNLGAMATAPFDDDDEPNIFWEKETEPASSEVVTFTAPGQAGEYQIVCGIPEHIENGMIASLTVR